MVGKITVKVEGLDELRTKIQALEDTAASVLLDAVKAGGEVLRAAAEARAPGPGIVMKVTKRSRIAAEVAIGPDKEHWMYQFAETGATAHEIEGTPLVFEGNAGTVVTGKVAHPGMAARPFLRPAADEKGQEAQTVVGERIRQSLEGV